VIDAGGSAVNVRRKAVFQMRKKESVDWQCDLGASGTRRCWRGAGASAKHALNNLAHSVNDALHSISEFEDKGAQLRREGSSWRRTGRTLALSRCVGAAGRRWQ